MHRCGELGGQAWKPVVVEASRDGSAGPGRNRLGRDAPSPSDRIIRANIPGELTGSANSPAWLGALGVTPLSLACWCSVQCFLGFSVTQGTEYWDGPRLHVSKACAAPLGATSLTLGLSILWLFFESF